MAPTDTYVCTLSPEALKIATQELGEKPERREKDIQAIREWLKKYPYLNADASAASILSFLRVAKFSLERTKKRMEFYYTVKEAATEFFSNFDPKKPEIQNILKIGTYLPLEGRDKLGRRVVLMRSGLVDPKTTKLEDVFKISMMGMAILQKEWEDTAVVGTSLIIDMKGFSSGHLTQATPTLMKKASVTWQDCYPVRTKAVHHFNTHSVFHTMYNMVKPLLKEKMKNRVIVHGSDVQELFQYFPEETIPKDYGGKGKSIKALTAEWKKKFEENREYLIHQEQFKSDESKRPGPKRDIKAEIFGIEGSFRKLEID